MFDNPIPTDQEVDKALRCLSERRDELIAQLQSIEHTQDIILSEFAAAAWRNGSVASPDGRVVH